MEDRKERVEEYLASLGIKKYDKLEVVIEIIVDKLFQLDREVESLKQSVPPIPIMMMARIECSYCWHEWHQWDKPCKVCGCQPTK